MFRAYWLLRFVFVSHNYVMTSSFRTALLSLTLLAVLASGCHKTGDEALLRAALDDMVEAVEKKESKRVLSHLADHFSGPNEMNRDGARGLMAYHLLRNQNIKVFVAGVRVAVKGQEAD